MRTPNETIDAFVNEAGADPIVRAQFVVDSIAAELSARSKAIEDEFGPRQGPYEWDAILVEADKATTAADVMSPISILEHPIRLWFQDVGNVRAFDDNFATTHSEAIKDSLVPSGADERGIERTLSMLKQRILTSEDDDDTIKADWGLSDIQRDEKGRVVSIATTDKPRVLFMRLNEYKHGKTRVGETRRLKVGKGILLVADVQRRMLEAA